ncbi:MAG: ABC transporter ATP-binding protein/permease [Xanthomonadales bacterium]|nr:ABC transporter ATP-binding protein/permease [Xanthomonadales bacterium]
MATDSSHSALKRLLSYTRALRRRVWLASACSVINKLFDVMPEILIGIAIDVVVRQEDSFIAALGIESAESQMILLGVLTFLIWAGESLFQYFHLVLWRNLAQDVQHGLRMDAYRHLQRLDMAYFEDRSSGNLVAILNDDVNQLERFLDGGANDLIQVATTIIAVGGVFIAISPLLALLSFTPIPVIVLGAFYFQRRAQPLYAQVREKVGALSSRLANNIAGMTTIKSFVTENLEAQRVEQESREYVQANRRAIAVSSAFIPLIRMAILAGFLATFIVGGWLTLQGELHVGAYGVLVFLTQRLLWPLTGLAQTADLYERAMASSRRILDLIEAPVQIADGDKRIQAAEVRGAIAFNRVSFDYGNQVTVLRDLSLTIEAGETVAFVGQTGSGKSTLVKLLLRLYAPSSGRITLDGDDIHQLQLDELRRSIGLVSQDVFLFQGSIAENIAYGTDNVSEADILAAAEAAEAMEFIQRLPAGMDTIVGERGQKLSGGQRQRLAIARAILKNPPVLVLDEATSAVDNETEAAIQRSLARISQARTTLIIAHRLSTIVDADRIYVLDQGRIAEAGNHAELIARDGIYRNLWQVQTGQTPQ